jgi:uncharacterized protein (DUF1499 family)
MPDNVSGVPRLAWRLSIVAAAAFVLGPVGAHFGLTKAMTGFLVFDLGGILGITSLVLGLIGVLRNSGDARRTATRGAALGGLVAVVFLGLAVSASGVPRINDITTDTERPPRFVAAQQLPENVERDMTYPGPSFADQQKKGYPNLSPLLLAVPPPDAYAKVTQAAKAMPDWTIIREDEAAFTLEGTATSRLFRFQDDFVVEVRPEVGGSAVHMRSKSRDGQGDVGANAARIRGFLAQLK